MSSVVVRGRCVERRSKRVDVDVLGRLEGCAAKMLWGVKGGVIRARLRRAESARRMRSWRVRGGSGVIVALWGGEVRDR